MIGNRIRVLRECTGYSQSELARRLSVTRASVNAWESGLSVPTASFIVELARLFHVSTDYILGVSQERQLNLTDLSEKEIHIIYQLVSYFEENKRREST